MKSIRVGIIVFLLALPAFAQDSLYFGIRNQFMGTRAMGMGNAFTAVADDNTAIFYNPAGLSQLKEGESNWFLKFDATPDIMDFYDDIDTAQNQANSAQAISDVLEQYNGEHFAARLPSIGMLWAWENWGFSVIMSDLSIDMGIDQSVGPGVNLNAINDTTFALSHNWKIKKWQKYGKFNVGVTGKAIYRMEVDKFVDIGSIELGDDIFDPEEFDEGLTFDADVGFLWEGPWDRYNPSAALVIRNVLDLGYIANMNLVGEGSGDPQNLNRVIDIGYAMDLPSWWVWTTKVAFDVRNILHPNWNIRKGVHLGAEFLWEVSTWFKGGWRAGINQGYLTAGFTGEFGVFRLDLATYGEELGVEGATKEARRYMLEMSLDF